jgi:hypothetical protein
MHTIRSTRVPSLVIHLLASTQPTELPSPPVPPGCLPLSYALPSSAHGHHFLTLVGAVGDGVGMPVGSGVGSMVSGGELGFLVGAVVGQRVGRSVGNLVGRDVGAAGRRQQGEDSISKYRIETAKESALSLPTGSVG